MDSEEEEETENDDTRNPKNLFKFLSEEDCFRKIETPTNISKGDIILMVLELALVHRFSHEQISDIFHLINNIFASPVVPETKYIIDKLFNPCSTTIIHVKCPKCDKYAGEMSLYAKKKRKTDDLHRVYE